MQTENGMGKEKYLYIIKNNPEKGKLCSSQQGISKVSWGCHGKNDGKNNGYVL